MEARKNSVSFQCTRYYIVYRLPSSILLIYILVHWKLYCELIFKLEFLTRPLELAFLPDRLDFNCLPEEIRPIDLAGRKLGMVILDFMTNCTRFFTIPYPTSHLRRDMGER